MKAYVFGKNGAFIECSHIIQKKDGSFVIFSEPTIREIYCERVVMVEKQKIVGIVPFDKFIDENQIINIDMRKNNENKTSENTG